MRVSTCLALFVVALALSVSFADALCTCKSASQTVGPCDVALKVCGCVKGFHWKYKCDASATGGGSASYEWTDSGEGAAKGAIVALLQSMTTPGECNGSAGVAPVGTCKIPYQIFFYFASSSDLDNKVASYKASVTAPNGAVSTVTAQTNAEDAVKNAVTAMVTANPAIATQCGL